jgi:hypothetical protein
MATTITADVLVLRTICGTRGLLTLLMGTAAKKLDAQNKVAGSSLRSEVQKRATRELAGRRLDHPINR